MCALYTTSSHAAGCSTIERRKRGSSAFRSKGQMQMSKFSIALPKKEEDRPASGGQVIMLETRNLFLLVLSLPEHEASPASALVGSEAQPPKASTVGESLRAFANLDNPRYSYIATR